MIRSNPIAARLRQVVSQDRMRIRDEETGADLDLTYLTTNIIAMGFPASGLESAWRNHIDDVATFLKHHHEGYFMIWNLSEREYDYSKFDNQLQDFGFPDHHSPPLDMLFQIILSMDNWLRASDDNVAVVHCMGGKGRTGTVIACYMLYCGLYTDPAQALSYFAERRSRIAKGVIQAKKGCKCTWRWWLADWCQAQPSQLRYVSYFGKMLKLRMHPRVSDVRIKKIMLRGVPKFSKKRDGVKAILKVYNVAQLPKRLLFASGAPEDTLFVDASQDGISWLPEVITRGDVMIKCKHYGKKKKETIFKATFHTAFVETIEKLEIKDLDAIIKPKKRFRPDQYPDDFAVVIYFEKGLGEAGFGGARTPAQRMSKMGADGTAAPVPKPSTANGVKPCGRCLLFIPKEASSCYLCNATQQ